MNEQIEFTDAIFPRGAASVEQARVEDERPTYTGKEIVVYICPTPNCTHYYGSPDMGDLGAQFTGPKTEDKPALQKSTGSTARHTRAACPFCRIRGVYVERVRMTIKVAVPTVGPPTPDLPRFHI